MKYPLATFLALIVTTIGSLRANERLASTKAAKLAQPESIVCQPTAETFPVRAVAAFQPAKIDAETIPAQPKVSDPQRVGAMRRLTEIRLSTAAPRGLMPITTPAASAPVVVQEAIGDEQALHRTRGWARIGYNWESSNLFHRPLYFEDVNAERYGNSALPALQPAISSVRFLTTVPLLPYKMALERPYEPIYVLGYYRPGDRTPNLGYRPPIRGLPTLAEAVVIGGVIAIFP